MECSTINAANVMQSNESLEDFRDENSSREIKKQNSHGKGPDGSGEKIRVYVRSSRTVISSEETGYPSYVPSSFSPLAPRAAYGGKRIFLYENQLDTEQERIVQKAADFAERAGLSLEVKDLGNQNVLQRIFSRLRNGAVTTPSIVFPGEHFVELEQGLIQKADSNVPMLQCPTV